MSIQQHKTPEALRDSTLALTQSMRTAAQAGDWMRVIEDEHQRRAIMTDYLRTAAPDQTAAFIDRVLCSDKIVMELGSKARDETAAELRSINKGQRAQIAYAASGD